VLQIVKSKTLSNAEIADRLSSLAQMLTVEKANPYKIRAYRRAAAVIRGLGESVDELVRGNADLRVYAGIGEALSAAIREIVETGTLKSLEKLRSTASPELVELSAHPRLDPQRVLRIYKKLGISTVVALRDALDSGQIERIFGQRMAQHVRYGLVDTSTILLYHAHQLCESIEIFLVNKAGAEHVEAASDYRRCMEIMSRFDFLIETSDFNRVVEAVKRYGGRTSLIESTATTATYSLPSGPLLCLERVPKKNWGLALIRQTGSAAHLRKLSRVTGSLTALENEVDILLDGTLDLPDDILRELDYTVCSIHSRFAMSREQQTERVLRAMDNRYFTVLGHATGRLPAPQAPRL
jgi:DNA polymerase (family 10)